MEDLILSTTMAIESTCTMKRVNLLTKVLSDQERLLRSEEADLI